MSKRLRLLCCVGLVGLCGLVSLPVGVVSAVEVSDDFNRTDSIDISPWIKSGGTQLQIVSNALQMTTGPSRYAMRPETFGSEQSAQATMKALTGTGALWFLVLNSATNNPGDVSPDDYYYAGCLDSTTLVIGEFTAGTQTQHASVSSACSTDAVFLFDRFGSELTLYKNGVEMISYDDPSPRSGDYLGFWLAGNGTRADDFTAEDTPSLPSCLEIGISYETREAGVGNDWEPVTDLNDWPELSFGDAIRWTIELDDAITYEIPLQIDHLAFIQRGHTPIKNTGPVGYFINYRLSPAGDDLYSELPGPDGEPIGQQLAKGAGVAWPIRMGSSEAQQVAPYTHTGTFLYLGDTGKEPDFFVQCSVYGGGGIENFGKDGDGGGSDQGCEALRVIAWNANTDDDNWGYRASASNVATPVHSVEYRYKPGGEPASDWIMILDFEAEPDGVFQELIQVPKVYNDGTNDHDILRSEIEWRCTDTKAGGGTETTGVTPEDGATAGAGSESCFTDGLGDMSLTSPKSWVVGIGKMGTCLVEWLFVPDGIGEEIEALRDELETQFPFSLGFLLVDFADELGTELESPGGTGCFDMGGDFSFGSFSVDVDDMCIGDGLAVGSTTRQLLAALMIAPILWAVCGHALRLVRGVSTDDS